MKTKAQKANLTFCIAVGVAIGVSQSVYQGVSKSHGELIGMAAFVLLAWALAGSVSWLISRWTKSPG